MNRLVAAALTAWTLLAAGCAAAPGSDRLQSASPADTSWIDRTAVYEVFVRDFSPEANFQGVLNGLDRIQGVGAEVVWLMPIHPIGEVNRKGPLGSAYSIRDYRRLNPDFGGADDFRALVQAVHGRGMKIILDWVPNHTAWDHVWVSSHPDFYTRNEAGEMTVPLDNDGKLTDWTDVVDLDYGNTEMRQAMIAEMRYWLDQFGIDGFRVDVAGMVPDDFWREAMPQLRAAGATLLLAEWGEPKMHELGFDLTYAWDSYHRLKAAWKGEPASVFVEREVDELRRIPEGGARLRFTTNHDETAWDDPPVTLFGGVDGARAAFVIMALLPGPPLIYNGQEVESPQKLGLFVQEPIDWARPDADVARAFYRRVIDLARTHDAFTSGTLEPLEVDAPDDVIAFRRGDAVVLVNTRARPVRVQVLGVRLHGAVDLLNGGVQQGSALALAAHGASVLELPR